MAACTLQDDVTFARRRVPPIVAGRALGGECTDLDGASTECIEY